jgi:hypothetical protein
MVCFTPQLLQTLSAIYPDAIKEIVSLLQTAKGTKLEITVVINADHAHNRKSWHSISGIIVFAGHTPGVWISKQATSIRSSFDLWCQI